MNWDLTRLYKTEEDYNKELELIKEYTKEAASYQGKLNDAKNLLAFMKLQDKTSISLTRAYNYANMSYDLNQKNIEALNRYQIVYGIFMELISALSFGEAEIIAVGKDNIDKMIEENEALKEYKFFFKKIFNNQAHVLSANEEKLLSYYNAPTSDINDLYDQLDNADRNPVKVTLSTGEEIEVNISNYTGFLESLANQDDRRKVFEAVYKHFDDHKNTFAAIYKGIIDSDVANMKARGYDSILSSFLEHNNIPNDVFLSLVKVCRENAEPVKRYYELRRKAFGLERLHTYDRFLNLREYTKRFTYEEAKNLFFESVKAIGGDFEKRAHMVVESGRVDVEIKDGKRSGAYSTGCYDEGPFILLNFDGRLDDCFTLAHEAGHSTHTSYANDFQPVSTAEYTIFVAEVASTFNEQLLLDYLLKNSNDKDLKIVILQNAIDGIIGTFYRQTLFANYEYLAHNLAINGEAITEQSLSQIMIDLYKDYYGHDLLTEDYKKYVWAYIPHLFHTPFYVYQYATSYASSLDIYERVKSGDKEALENYINLLKSGGSDYPVTLLQRAGVDLTKTDAYYSVVKRLESLVDTLEKLLSE